MDYFCQSILGDKLPAYVVSQNEELEGSKVYITHLDFRRQIELHYEKDMKLYHQIMAKRMLRTCDSIH